ncbi:MAG: hypothetical protein IJV41_08880 [Oscillospiraceae bacterium]|nr:hypothetical protein [Oscillospiraceae bacterium]
MSSGYPSGMIYLPFSAVSSSSAVTIALSWEAFFAVMTGLPVRSSSAFLAFLTYLCQPEFERLGLGRGDRLDDSQELFGIGHIGHAFSGFHGMKPTITPLSYAYLFCD